MKIRNRWMIQWIGLVGAWLIRLYMGTISFRIRQPGPVVNPRHPGVKGPFIYAFFHENILLPCAHFAMRNIHVLISQHADGEIIARICHHLGFSTIRGSSTRGGVEALRKMIRAGRACHIAVIPDGPRGPRRHVEPGLIYLAARTGLPIVVAGIGYRNPWRLGTWDRFAVPRPFSRAQILLGAPIAIPPSPSKSELEEHRLAVEAELRKISDEAERLANR